MASADRWASASREVVGGNVDGRSSRWLDSPVTRVVPYASRRHPTARARCTEVARDRPQDAPATEGRGIGLVIT